MSSGLVIRKNRPKDGPKFKNFVLMQELEKRSISATQFAFALGIPVTVVRGVKGDFPIEKLDQCVELLNNWTGPTAQRGNRMCKPDQCSPVSREMLVTAGS
jgi:hypothetical protein